MSGILNVLNGQAMFDYYVKNKLNINGNYIPFNEAMCEGVVTQDIFSTDFIEKRCLAHHVSLDEYKKITLEPLKSLLEKDFSKLFLWFDEDMFCQINLLTILAYLNQVNYYKPINIVLVTKDFKLIDTYELNVYGYEEIYHEVMINHQLASTKLAYLQKGIELYLEYIKTDNEITLFIEKNISLSENELLSLLFNTFPQYGLGDTQYLKLINKIKNR